MRRSRALLTAALTAGLAITPLASVSAAPAKDPSVLSWGAGRTGQLGNGATKDSTTPVPVTSLVRGDVERISAGGTSSDDSFALALTDGAVKAWGQNAEGQLGNGDRTNRNVPTDVARLGADIKDVAAGGQHGLALDGQGRVYSWGENTYGQLGNNRTGDVRAIPNRVQGMPKVKQVSAGCDFSMALAENGKVYAWGRGVFGQLGSGTRATSSAPREIEGLENITEIDAGCHHALALTADKTVKAWGKNSSGQLGDSSTKSSTRPVDVDWIENVTDIEAGANHNYVITDDDMVWGWGDNQNNQLLEADPAAAKDKKTLVNRTTPIEIPRLEGAEQIAAGAHHGIAVFGEDVFAWGHNAEGQLGNNASASGVQSVHTLNVKPAVEHVAASLGGNTSYAY